MRGPTEAQRLLKGFQDFRCFLTLTHTLTHKAVRICGGEGGSHQGPLKFPRFPEVADLGTPTHKGPAAPENRLPRIRPPKTPRWRVERRGSATRDRSPVPEPIELSQTGRLRLGNFPRSGFPGPGSLVCGCPGLCVGVGGINSLERK